MSFQQGRSTLKEKITEMEVFIFIYKSIYFLHVAWDKLRLLLSWSSELCVLGPAAVMSCVCYGW